MRQRKRRVREHRGYLCHPNNNMGAVQRDAIIIAIRKPFHSTSANAGKWLQSVGHLVSAEALQASSRLQQKHRALRADNCRAHDARAQDGG